MCIRDRADAGFGFHPVLSLLEQRPAQYAVAVSYTHLDVYKRQGVQRFKLEHHGELGGSQKLVFDNVGGNFRRQSQRESHIF